MDHFDNDFIRMLEKERQEACIPIVEGLRDILKKFNELIITPGDINIDLSDGILEEDTGDEEKS